MNINQLITDLNYIVENTKDINLSFTNTLMTPSNPVQLTNINPHSIQDQSSELKLIDLSLNWLPHDSNFVQGSQIIITKPYKGNRYCIRSQEILSKPFICKIAINKMFCCIESWVIIKEPMINEEDYFYNDSALFHVSGKCPGHRYSSVFDVGTVSDIWKEEDDIIIKLDHD